ncbi:nucleotidyl transferase AbiEii/AbiGii toxin family protein [Pseudidiomarina taiwanensis]|uniref:Nucleotidyltransferase n=1 Tax=Pseudidiomarina taiwanensis TaxID=337250 RepID=A0A432ZEI2_9GAMM|nr:nucleotidyl transferase AbiEii/AbiGii toxin family protein [Pseudidiomarina taiwanensis]RUO76331.1 nucleotidyltransferase [Pseudidiomarina taiwanensis]
MNEAYKRQVKLLLDVLPEIAKEDCFAMHGGTAINLFLQDMPRLSVDIDLTYVGLEVRAEALAVINAALLRIKDRVDKLRATIRVQHKPNVCKLQMSEHGIQIKVEVNMVGCGLLGPAKKLPLCSAAQEQYNVFCAMPVVPLGQLYGGKICAALDRQHPRDLFDTKLLLENIGFIDEIKRGFMFALISSNRPTHEMLAPNLFDQRAAFENQFEGMSNVVFSYTDFETTRLKLIETVRRSLNEADKQFLLSFNGLEPDWSVYNYHQFPSVKWKLMNLAKFKKESAEAYQLQLEQLAALLKS